MTPGSARTQQGLRVLDEALRLLDALHVEPAGRPSASDPEAEAGRDDASHQGWECRVCPVCRGMAALRAVNPEATQRMGRAVAELAAAIGDLVVGPERARADEPAESGATDDARERREAGEPADPTSGSGPRADVGIEWYVMGESNASSRVTVQRIDVTE